MLQLHGTALQPCLQASQSFLVELLMLQHQLLDFQLHACFVMEVLPAFRMVKLMQGRKLTRSLVSLLLSAEAQERFQELERPA